MNVKVRELFVFILVSLAMVGLMMLGSCVPGGEMVSSKPTPLLSAYLAPLAPTTSPIPTVTAIQMVTTRTTPKQANFHVVTPTIVPQIAEPPIPTPIVTQPDCSRTLQPNADILALINAVSRENLMHTVQTLEGFGTRHTLSTTESPTMGIGAARNWLFNEFVRIGNNRLQVSFHNFPMVISDGTVITSRNVVATLPGSVARQDTVILMAHYDSRSLGIEDGTSLAPGANDNASGVALMLEVARLLSQGVWNQTIIFVAFAGEEQETQGSDYYVREALAQRMVIEAAFNNDIVGGQPGIRQSVRIFSMGPNSSAHRQLARYMQLVGSLYLPVFPVELQDGLDRDGRYSDQREFVTAHIPALRVIQSEEATAVQHSNLDTFDRIDYTYLYRVTQLNLATLANAIGAPMAPDTPQVTSINASGSYLVTWQPDPQAASYLIFYRPVDSLQFRSLQIACSNQVKSFLLAGLDPGGTYAISLAAVDADGRISLFSPEVVISGL